MLSLAAGSQQIDQIQDELTSVLEGSIDCDISLNKTANKILIPMVMRKSKLFRTSSKLYGENNCSKIAFLFKVNRQYDLSCKNPEKFMKS